MIAQLYDLPDGLNPESVRSQADAAFFYNGNDSIIPEKCIRGHSSLYIDNRTRTALHAPTSKDWVMSIRYPFGKNPR